MSKLSVLSIGLFCLYIALPLDLSFVLSYLTYTCIHVCVCVCVCVCSFIILFYLLLVLSILRDIVFSLIRSVVSTSYLFRLRLCEFQVSKFSRLPKVRYTDWTYLYILVSLR